MARQGAAAPELLVDFITSLDGYASAVGWPGWWGCRGPDISLELIESRTFDGRIQLLDFVPTILDGPPGAGDSA